MKRAPHETRWGNDGRLTNAENKRNYWMAGRLSCTPRVEGHGLSRFFNQRMGMRHGLMGSERRRKDGCKGQYKGTYRQQCLNDKEGDNNSKKRKERKRKKPD